MLGGRGDERLDVVAGARLDLDGDVARDVGAPALRGLGDQNRAAGGEAGEKRHDGDDDDQRAAGDRIGGHQRHVALELRIRRHGGRERCVHGESPSKIFNCPVADDEASGVAELIHQRQVVGGDDDRGAGFVQFDEQPQQAARQGGIDVAGRLVGEQQLGAHDERAGDRRALLLAAGEHRRQGVHPVAEADPAQELDHFGAIAALRRGPSP